MVVKVPDVKFVLAPQGALRAPKAQAPRVVWGQIDTQKCRFQRFSGRAGVHSSLVKSKILNENGL